MATLQEIKPIPTLQRRAASPHAGLRLHIEDARKRSSELLRRGLNKYQRKLNAKLLASLDDAFAVWLENTQTGILAQLKTIPARARDQWLQERVYQGDRRRSENQAARFVLDFLLQYTQRQVNDLRRWRAQNQTFRRIIGKARTERERQLAVLQYAEQLGATPRQLRGDEQAFQRWFDEEAVNDRYVKLLGQRELLLTFVFDRLAEVLVFVLQLVHQCHQQDRELEVELNTRSLSEKIAELWQRLSIEASVRRTLEYGGDPRIHTAALRCLRRGVAFMPAGLAEETLDEPTLLLLHQIAAEGQADVWLQCEALAIVYSISKQQAQPLLERRLAEPMDGDDMFVRRRILQIFEQELLSGRRVNLQLPNSDIEASPFVRQKTAKVAFLLRHTDSGQRWSQFVLEDDSPQVRAAALLSTIEVECDINDTVEFLEVVVKSVKQETNPFVVRVACHVITKLLQQLDRSVSGSAEPQAELISKRSTIHAFYQQRIEPVLHDRQCSDQTIPLRRWIVQTRELAWALIDQQAAELIRWLRPIIPTIKPGTTRKLEKKRFRGLSDEKLGRILAVLSQRDFGLDLHRGWFQVHMTRGPVFGFRLWRLIHEFSETATDKRQALRHTVGRINSASMRAPSQILGELSETKIPGEPLMIADDGTWRPFIPLLDDFISILNRSWIYPATTRFYSSQGVTEVRGPKTIWKQLSAAVRLNFQFRKLAVRRNWNEDSYPASNYIESIRKLGFQVNFRSYQTDTPSEATPESQRQQTAADDETVTRFFNTACAVPLLFLGSWLESAREQFLRYADYFGSSFENSIEHLLIFASLILVLVLAKHAHSNYTFRKARQNIPISIGGWGTRGKSGTERLKAALVGAMGHGLVSKTTGCEAMFIHGDPFGEPLEIPLFRPYEKATIWEQRNLILMASKMEPSVFLWECMALTPSYVDVLQRQWTCDDLGTITNTYPDHEDLQGPAGHDVATTISGFVPEKSHLITSEEQMRPYVAESCRNVDTSFRGVGWLESGLVTNDVLARFPYQEHPDNVALVAAMGDELGVEYDVALKAMGDYLVPDLGVLKSHPVSTVRTRKIEFTNGMSANERFGCMGNWKRLGFDTQDPWDQPTTWVCGVVNNRADRVPRSKVFAKIIVEDMSADRFFLIGNNLGGLKSFIHEAWEEKAKTLSLCDRGQPWQTDFAVATFKQAARRFRQPISAEHIQAKLQCMLQAVASTLPQQPGLDLESLMAKWDAPDEVADLLTKSGASATLVQAVAKHHLELTTALGEYEEMLKIIQNATPQQTAKVAGQYVELLETWYFRKLVVVENYDATGEEVVACLVDETPPGFLNRTIGLQNIKGTGLDFVYRFQAWDVCYEACLAAENDDPNIATRGLQALLGMPVIGQLCTTRVREVIEHAKQSKTMRRPDLQILLQQLEDKLVESDPAGLPETKAESSASTSSATEADAGNSPSSPPSLATWNKWLIDTSEEFLDVNDSLRRRDQADAIYRDLAASRISRQRAVAELRKINKRQKGGWLTSLLTSKKGQKTNR